LCTPWLADAQEQKTRVTVFLVPAKGYDAQTIANVSRKLITSLRKNINLDVEDSDKLLVQFSGEAPRTTIREADPLVSRGTKALEFGRPAEAEALFERAVTTYESIPAFIKKRALARAHLALGIAQAESGKHELARSTFIKLLTWRPLIKYDSQTFSATHAPLFASAKKRVKRLKRGSVELVTDPSGAKAYLNGRFMGVTPTVVFGLTVGDHYATFKKAGYVKAASRISISPTMQKQYSLTLKRSEKFLLLKQSLDNAIKGLGQPKANSAMQDLRSFLFIDQAVFTMVGYAGPGKLRIRAFLFDLRSSLRLNHVSRVVEQRSLHGLEELARLLYLNVKYDGTMEAPPEAPPPPPPKRSPLYATWWLWTAIGAGLVTAIVVPYAVWPESDTIGKGQVLGFVDN
jgi:tetratricopeptide (TPR) repeat protein